MSRRREADRSTPDASTPMNLLVGSNGSVAKPSARTVVSKELTGVAGVATNLDFTFSPVYMNDGTEATIEIYFNV